MSPGFSISVHWWRGIGPEVQRNLFFFGFRLGVVTISVERAPVLAAYRVLRKALAERVASDRRKEEGR